MTAGFEIRPEDPRHPAVLALLTVHLDTMAQQSPPESRHALDVTGLCGPAIAFRAAWQGETLAGIGALMALGKGESELKSMHTAAAFRGQGVARGMLGHLLALARGRGDRRVSLETGSQPGFAASRALYASAGFVECPPFAAYRLDPNSTFMTLAL